MRLSGGCEVSAIGGRDARFKPLSWLQAIAPDADVRWYFGSEMARQLRSAGCMIIREMPFMMDGTYERAFAFNKSLHQLPDDLLALYQPRWPNGREIPGAHGMFLGEAGPKSQHRFWRSLRPLPDGLPRDPNACAARERWPIEPGFEDYGPIHLHMLEQLYESFIVLMRRFCEGFEIDYRLFRPCLFDDDVALYGHCNDGASSEFVGHRSDSALLQYVMGENGDVIFATPEGGDPVSVSLQRGDTVILIGDALHQLSNGAAPSVDYELVYGSDGDDPQCYRLSAQFTGNSLAS